jgi:hypothetical protein
MNSQFRDAGLIVGLAALWAISGYIIGAALEAFGLNSYSLGIIIASLNVIIGMLWLKGIIRDPVGDRLFFEGPASDEEGDIRIGCLWVMPAVLGFIGILLWFWVIIFRFIDK